MVDDRWVDQTSIEIDELTALFREFIDSERLDTIWQICWAPGVDEARARAELGTVPATPPQWSGNPSGYETSIQDLDEMSVGLYLAS